MKISNFFLAILFMSAPALADTISIRADAWCPYNCDPGATPGYGIEILQEAVKAAGHNIDYKIEPWKRALKNAQDGVINAVIGAAAEDAQEFKLKIGKQSIGASSNCAFAQAGSKAKLIKASDLSQFKKIGFINDYTYTAEIDAWIKDPANKSKIDMVGGDEPVISNVRKLEAGRIDATVEDEAVMGFTLKKLAVEKKIVSVGCTDKVDIFIAFNSNNKKSDEYLKLLDEGIVAMKKSGKLKEILAKYGVSQ